LVGSRSCRYMSPTVADIERVVRQVLAEMAAAPADSASSATIETPMPSAPSEPKAPADALVLTDRVVTLAQLEGRTAAMRRLIVPQGAVVTPAVRDELRRRRMTLEYGNGRRQTSDVRCRLAVWNVSKRYDPAPLMAAVEREGIPAHLETSTCLIATTDALAPEVRRGDTVGLILTRAPAVALCLANRHAGVRAVIGLDAPQVAADLAAVGGNVLAVDWAACTLFQIKQMIAELCSGAPRACPDELKQRLT
jgi:hypothetical protein